MNAIRLLTVAATALLAAPPLGAQELHYWGQVTGVERRGWIERQGQHADVGEGDEIPGVGVVQEVRDDVLVVRRTLTDDEKQRLRVQGQEVVDVKVSIVPNLWRRVGR
ncbi:MAG TPA: hypothetical protein VGV13_05635 [Methylomirabilota bacterium]|jgi:hypothetical protein|nr:hypothetical protein [Methylomirabilota bacterium]